MLAKNNKVSLLLLASKPRCIQNNSRRLPMSWLQGLSIHRRTRNRRVCLKEL